MNAILLGAAALGTLAAMYASPMADRTIGARQDPHLDRGWMTHTVELDQQTGETTVIDSIGFID